MAAVLTRGLNTVRAEFNNVFARRDKASDGWLGDLAHQTGPSGHNPDLTGRPEYKDGDGKDEVRAIDVDADLIPGSGVDWMDRAVQYLILRGRAGYYLPFRYLIYKGRIWAKSDGWRTRTYTGANKHDKHAHFSGDYTQTADEWTGSLGLATLIEEPDMNLTDKVGNKRIPDRTVQDFFNDWWAWRDVMVGEVAPPAGTPLAELVKMGDQWPSAFSALAAERAEVVPTADQVANAVASKISPATADAVADRVVQRIGAMPDVEVHVGETVLKAAILAAVHDLTAPEAS